MTAHDHKVLTEGCYRCEFNEDEGRRHRAGILAEARRVVDHPPSFYDKDDLFDILAEVLDIAEYRKDPA